ncbi:hypothetical protein GF337_02495 [candidate division KSB1 bacterium]|nr:hypothetical protein [candidate division KSB1 bacterium]
MQNDDEKTLAFIHKLEFLSVATNRRQVNFPLKMHDAIQKISMYASSFHLVSPTPDTFAIFIRLLKSSQIRENIFDLYLAATAMSNNVDQICTWNIKDFEKIEAFHLLTPEEILSSL